MLKVMLCIVYFSLAMFSDSTGWDTTRPDAHGPIGVMGEHTHHIGEFMVSVRQMSMAMGSLYNGTDSVSDATALSSYTMVPTDMSMQMTMLGGMYAPSNELTVMAMVNYTSNDMDMTNGMMSSDMSSEGFSDLKLGALYSLEQTKNCQWIVNGGLSLPIGSIDEENSDGDRLAYAMQLGSGTYDINLGTTYTAQLASFSYGAQALGTFRLGENSNGYALGNQYNVTSWIQKPITNELSVSARGTTKIIDDISGSDSTLMATMSPTNSTEQGRIIADVGIGANYYAQSGILAGNRLALEYNIPVYHHTNSTQLVTESVLTFGLQRGF
jgi:hypothetical protein